MLGEQSPAYAEYSVATGVQYDSFSNDRSPEGSGSETTFPFQFTYAQEDLFIGFEMAYSYACVDPGTDSDSNISSITDSLLTASFTVPNLPVHLLMGFEVNFPTGKEQLSEDEKIVEAGENNDLFHVDDFGEGLNVGLHLALVKEIGDMRFGMYGEYTFNGRYDPSSDLVDDNFDPGDQMFLMTAFDWQMSPQIFFDMFIAYAHFGVDEINNADVFQEGDKLVIGSDLHVQHDLLGVTVSLQNSIQAKNDELVAEVLQTESENSNRYEFLGALEINYEYSPDLIFRWLGNLHYYGESKRKDPINELPVEGKRVRYALGSGFSYALAQNIIWNGTAQYFVLNQERDCMLDNDVTYRGINLGVGVTYTF